jgi:thiosulfate dehydrogenase
MGRVVVLGEMINWCIMNPLEGEALALDDPAMVALEAYIHHERSGVALAPGKH